MRKAMIAADNVVLATQGKPPKHTNYPFWGDAVIKLTLGMVSLCPSPQAARRWYVSSMLT
jgi:hypothetical protein